jgi:4-amino-4-deoxy-L-arabinose transferase-like glycosyltransferase
MNETYTPSKPTSSELVGDGRSEDSVRRRGGLVRRWREASPRARFLSIAVLLLLLALAVRVGYVIHTDNFATRLDSHSYDQLAQQLARGNGWAYGPSAYRPPGYPIFLAGIYLLVGIPHGVFTSGIPHGVFTSVRLVEAVFATLTVGLLGLLALQVGGRTAMLITLAVGAIYLPLVLVGVSLMSESLFALLVLAATNCAVRARAPKHRYRWIVLAGAFAGLSALTHGNGLVLALALPFVVWTGRPRLSRAAIAAPALLLVVMALTIMPWTIRNANAQHAFVPVTTELGPTLKGTYNNFSAGRRFIWSGHGYKDYNSITKNRNLTEAQLDSRLTSAVISKIGKHPAWLPEAMFWNTMRLLDLQGRRVSRMTAHTDEDATAAIADIGVISFWIIAALAIVGGFTSAARRGPRALWIVPLVLWLSVAPVTTGTPRFRAALDPFVIVLAAFGIQALAAALGRKGKASRPLGRLLHAPPAA